MSSDFLSPDAAFQFANPVAVIGWVALLLSPLAPRALTLFAGVVIPALLSVGYTAIVLAFWGSAPGGFDTLANVMTLFTSPEIALAGWMHYLAFDLFVGVWIARTARHEAIPFMLIVPSLALTFLFGPAGFLSFLAIRAAYAARASTPIEA